MQLNVRQRTRPRRKRLQEKITLQLADAAATAPAPTAQFPLFAICSSGVNKLLTLHLVPSAVKPS
eukprot:2506986-Rhodomonas_salina.1